MLLDSYVLAKGFEELITLGLSSAASVPAGYIKRVSQTMSRISPLLKTLQVRSSPPEALVQAYLIHIADKSDANFRKVLELKGIRKQDQGHLLEIFMAHKASPRHEKLPQYSTFLTPLLGQISGTSAGLGSSPGAAGPGAANQPGRFDPSMFGSAIMTAARDGVDRFGSPILGNGSSAGSRATSPPPAGLWDGNAVSSTNVNQNLRNIGKFFKRDLGGFGGRFSTGRNGDDGMK